jgi:hypothetical protein
MKFGEQPKLPTPEEMAKIQDERALSDVEMINNGAGHVVRKDGDLELEFSEEQKKKIEEEYEELHKQEPVKEMSPVELSEYFGEECRKLRKKFVLSNKDKDEFDIINECEAKFYNRTPSKGWCDLYLKNAREALEYLASKKQ